MFGDEKMWFRNVVWLLEILLVLTVNAFLLFVVYELRSMFRPPSFLWAVQCSFAWINMRAWERMLTAMRADIPVKKFPDSGNSVN